MRYIRSRFGIVTWCITALLILIVPLWRLRATRQLQSPFVKARLSPLNTIEEDLQPSDSFGVSAKLGEQAARRFPDEVSAQLADLDAAQFVANSQSNALPAPTASYQNERQLALAQANLAARAKNNWKSSDAYFARFDDLEKRFPQSNLVRAAHLHAAMTGTILMDQGPQFSYRYEGNKLVEVPFLMVHPENWMSPAARERAIEAARAGAKSDSDNAFWPWMEAMLQLSLGYNDKALRALEEAGKDKRFDDYGLVLASQRIAILKQLRATGWEDEWNEYSALPSAYFYKMRSAVRAVAYQQKLARQKGDEKAAFRWGAASARASSVVALTAQSLVGKFVGQALCAISWSSAAEGIPTTLERLSANASDAERTAYSEARQRDAVARFVRLARQNGDENLARQTVAVFGQFDLRRYSREPFAPSTKLSSAIWRLSNSYWLHAQLLCLSLVAAVIWGAMWLLTAKHSAKITLVRQRILLWTMFLAGVTGVLLVFARGFMPELDALQQSLFGTALPTQTPEPNLRTFAAAWPYSVSALWVIFALIGAILGVRSERKLGDEHPKKASWKRFFCWLLSLIFVASTVLIVAAPTLPIVFTLLGVLPLLLWLSSFVIGSILMVLWSRGKARLATSTFVGSLWAGVTALFLVNGSVGDGLFYSQILWSVAGILMLVALFFAFRDGVFPVVKFKSFGFQLAARTRIAAGALALLSAVAYLAIALWTIPVERQARAMMERQLQIGEVAWLREQMAVQQPLSTAGR